MNLKAKVVIRKFTTLFGVQKMRAQWHRDFSGSQEAKAAKLAGWMAEIEQDWQDQLDRFSEQTILAALQALVDKGSEWPPTLPEFVRLCRDHMRPESQPVAKALPAPGGSYTDNESARKNIERVRGMLPSLAYKKRVGVANSALANGRQAVD